MDRKSQYRQNYERPRQGPNFNYPENKFKELQNDYPDIPGVYIQKVLHELTGEENVRQALLQESKKISQFDHPDWVKDYYKALQCQNKSRCLNPICRYYHQKGERRRVYKYKKYSHNFCPQASQCSDLDQCEFSHTINEILYHPLIYRSKPCPYMKNEQFCPLAEFCPLSHEILDEAQALEEFLSAHQKLDSLYLALYNVENDIKEKLKIEEDYMEQTRCQCGYDKDYLRDPCGHAACSECFSNPICKYCRNETIAYKINFD
ncbi:hypothetical protein SteCoe_7889 [Stentor coeruleus]|uniref:C3H1-type domain-containing protein n=1 Tax=Stentor coeruleus TaxID=5963 RepID=A0A1R2CLS9_9CILI|nr:hypothetical protein SteCoe_7889 [Stentor coeruleus]